jgi:poly(3-hydroxybutyrate) depolymerase
VSARVKSSVVALAVVAALAACTRSKETTPAPAAPRDAAVTAEPLDVARAAALASIERARQATLPEVSRAISLPSIERLVADADAVRGRVTDAARDLKFVRGSYETARAYADVLSGGEDPYDYARGAMVKAYRSEWDASLQPYALYVPKDYDPSRAWPLVVALHGLGSNHRHMLRRVFGLGNRPGETDEEASRNELPFPDVPALVVAPYGRGEGMGYDGLGGEDVLRVVADVRRAYKIDPARVSLTGLSMGGGGTWQLGLAHPELWSALAPICGPTDVRRWTRGDATRWDEKALEALSPPAFAENAAGLRVFIFHGDADPVVSVEDSRRMAARFKALGWLGKSVTYTEYKGVGHDAWTKAYEGAKLLSTLAALRRDPKAPAKARKPVPPGVGLTGIFSMSPPRERPHLYVYGTHGAPDAVAAARALAEALADWGPRVSARFTVKADTAVTDADEKTFELVLVGAAPLNALAADVKTTATAEGDRAFRLVAPSPWGEGRHVLVMGALSPAGFAKLQPLARPRADDDWSPETNLPLRTF